MNCFWHALHVYEDASRGRFVVSLTVGEEARKNTQGEGREAAACPIMFFVKVCQYGILTLDRIRFGGRSSYSLKRRVARTRVSVYITRGTA